jgi:serine protease AprX
MKRVGWTALCVFLMLPGLAAATARNGTLYIIQAGSTEAAEHSVQRLGASLERRLPIIHAVAARLHPWQVARLHAMRGVRLYEDRTVSVRGTLLGSVSGSLLSTTNTLTSTTNSTVATSPVGAVSGSVVAPVTSTVTTSPLVSTATSPLVSTVTSSTSVQDGTGVADPSLLFYTNFPARIGADTLQKAGLTGAGVTIAVLDSGLWQDLLQNYGTRVLATQTVLNGATGPVQGDAYGHGTHVTSIAAGGAQNLAGQYLSIAPRANLVEVQAFNGKGQGRYVDVIAGINWIVANRQKYNIRVLNLSFGAPPQSYYWDDPLNQAVMAAWQAGIVVVAAAGNAGPSPMTVEVPGNVPYVITVGALTDNYTPNDYSDDRLASFSSTGPTYEGFVKPELIAPGGHITASMSSAAYLANIDPNSMMPGENLFTMSGTSMAAAVTSGVVALMIQADPSLTPDTIKCRLMASAEPAVTSAGTLAYSVFQQGAGLIDALAAVSSGAGGCANVGLNVTADLAGTTHFGGPANETANGQFYIMNMGASFWGTPQSGDGLTWDAGYPWGRGYAWNQGYAWSGGYSWSYGYAWNNGDTWAKTATWTQGDTWAKTATWSGGYSWSSSVPWWTSSQPQPSTSTAPASIESWVPNQ